MKRSARTPLSRRREIEAAVAAYDNANPLTPLPRSAAWLLAVMFPTGDLCQQSRRSLPGTLFQLVRAGQPQSQANIWSSSYRPLPRSAAMCGVRPPPH